MPSQALCHRRQSLERFSEAVLQSKEIAHHFTSWAFESNTTLIVVHEKRAIEGYPNVLSRDSLIHVFVFGSAEGGLPPRGKEEKKLCTRRIATPEFCRPGSFDLCLRHVLLSVLLEYPAFDPSVTRHLRCDTRSADYRIFRISFRGHREVDAGELRCQKLFVLFCGTKSIDKDLRVDQLMNENESRNRIATSVNSMPRWSTSRMSKMVASWDCLFRLIGRLRSIPLEISRGLYASGWMSCLLIGVRLTSTLSQTTQDL